MIFHIWTLYASKVAIALAAVVVILLALGRFDWAGAAVHVLFYALFGIGITGGLLCIWWLIYPSTACPLCGERGEVCITSRRQPALDCPKCGLVYVNNSVLDFHFTVISNEDEDAGSESQ